MAAVSKLVRDAAKARLQAVWAAKVTAVSPGYGGVPAAEVAKLGGIDWTGAARRQVFQGQLDIASLEASTAVTYPLVILYTSDAANDGEEKFSSFSGSVALNLEFHLTWAKSAALPNFDEYLDLIEDAIIEVFHDKAWIGALAGLTYRGEMTAQRGAVQEGADSWLQALAFRLVFGVDV